MQYNEFAYVYDCLMHEDIDYDKWCDYIENLFDAHNADVNSICELACGTGNMTAILKRRGYKMTASDISKDMLSVAKKKLKNTKQNIETYSKCTAHYTVYASDFLLGRCFFNKNL